MKFLVFVILFFSSFSASAGGSEWFEIEPELKQAESLVEIRVKNSFESRISCVGEASAFTYFNKTSYDVLQLATLEPNQTISLFVRSRYGDPIIEVWTTILCRFAG
jgi:hypothetical protein